MSFFLFHTLAWFLSIVLLACPVKVGILHSLTGTMAISEQSLVNAELTAIHEINLAGGLLGENVDVIVEDGGSNATVFAQKAEAFTDATSNRLVQAVFGCWTSSSRKAVLPSFERHGHILFYPVHSEGQECSQHVFYTGATPNQQIEPAVEWLVRFKSRTFFLVGSDDVFPRTANAIIRAQLRSLGGSVAGELYLPLEHPTNESVAPSVAAIQTALPSGGVIFNTLSGDSNVLFFHMLYDSGMHAETYPVMSVGVSETEIAVIGAIYVEGHFVSANYFMNSADHVTGEGGLGASWSFAFVEKYQAIFGTNASVSDPMVSAYVAVHLWAQAVSVAGTFAVGPVRNAMINQAFQLPQGEVTVLANHHLSKFVHIGRVTPEGSFEILFASTTSRAPDPWSYYIASSRGHVCDWTNESIGGFHRLTTTEVALVHAVTGPSERVERTYLEAELVAIRELNAAGGLLGHTLLPVVFDTQSDESLALEIVTTLAQSGTAPVAILGDVPDAAYERALANVPSDSAPLLLNPARGVEGQSGQHVLHFGSVANQQLMSALEYFSQRSRGVGRPRLGFFIVAPESWASRSISVLSAYVVSLGDYVAGAVTVASHNGTAEISAAVASILQTLPLAEGGVVINLLTEVTMTTLMMKEMTSQGSSPAVHQILSVAISHSDIPSFYNASSQRSLLTNHYVPLAYASGVETLANAAFTSSIGKWYGSSFLVTETMESAYVAVLYWGQGVADAGTFQSNFVQRAMTESPFDSPMGRVELQSSNYVSKPICLSTLNSKGDGFRALPGSTKNVVPMPYWLHPEISLNMSHDYTRWIDLICLSGQGLVDASGNFVAAVNEATGCEWCPRGFYSWAHVNEEEDSIHECTPCSPGLVQATPGQTQCDACEAGRYTSSSGQFECDYCSMDTFQPDTGQSDCVYCSMIHTMSVTHQLGATSHEECTCPAGYYATVTFHLAHGDHQMADHAMSHYADDMEDHSDMEHYSHHMDHQMSTTANGMDHSHMEHYSHQMDDHQMDDHQMSTTADGMDHSHMDHYSHDLSTTADGMDHSHMDHYHDMSNTADGMEEHADVEHYSHHMDHPMSTTVGGMDHSHMDHYSHDMSTTADGMEEHANVEHYSHHMDHQMSTTVGGMDHSNMEHYSHQIDDHQMSTTADGMEDQSHSSHQITDHQEEEPDMDMDGMGRKRRLSESLEGCTLCPTGMVCDGGSDARYFPSDHASVDLVTGTYPTVMYGFMTRFGEPLKVYKCLRESHCLGGAPGSCAEHRDPSSVGCGRCVEGAYTDDDKCKLCGGGLLLTPLISMFVAALGVCVLTIIVNRNVVMQTDRFTTCTVVSGILFSALQALQVMSQLSITWMTPIDDMILWTGVLSFNFNILKTGCIMSEIQGFACRLLVAPLAMPVVLVTLLLKKNWQRDTHVCLQCVNSIGYIYYIFFISIMITSFLPFICYDHPSGGSSMTSNASVLCFEGGDHSTYVVLGVTALLALPLPFLTLAVLATVMYPSLLRSKGKDKVRLQACRFLFFRFKPERYYYGVVNLLRSFLICMVPVFTTRAAVQIITMVTVLAVCVLVQQQLSPWPSPGPNVADGMLNTAILLLLVCGALVTSVETDGLAVQVAAVAVFSLFVVLPPVTLSFALYTSHRERSFHHFICHHKKDASAQARLMKMILQQRTGQKVFIDSDDLKELGQLFDIVRCKVKHVIVYLTASTLSRSWCAGEIATADVFHVTTTVIKTPSFLEPEQEELDNLELFLDGNIWSLAKYNISLESVRLAYTKLLGPDSTVVHMNPSMKGTACFDAVVSTILSVPARVEHPGQVSVESGAVVVTADPLSMEAVACTGILKHKIQKDVFRISDIGALWVLDCTEDAIRTARAIMYARCVIIVLAPGSLESFHVVAAIVDAMCPLGPTVIPVHLPHFVFPDDQYYSERLPIIWPGDATVARERIGLFFQRISIHFATDTSDQVLETQARDIVKHIPKSFTMRISVGEPMLSSVPLDVALHSVGEPSIPTTDTDEELSKELFEKEGTGERSLRNAPVLLFNY